MGKWRKVQLGELCELRAGSVFKPEYQGRTEGQFPFVKVSDMNLPLNGVRLRDANHWVSEEARKALNAKPFPPGTTVFAKIGEALKQNRLRQTVRDTLLDNNMMGAIPRPDIDDRFLFFALHQFDFGEVAGGSALPYLTVSNLARLELSLPLLHEQQAIASILGALDDKIELNRRMNQTLEEMAQAIFKSWFVDFDGHAEFEETELGRIPKGWHVGPLDELLVLQRGFDLPKHSRTPGPFPIVAASGPTEGHAEARVKAPGVVTGRSGVLGKVFLLLDDFWPLNTALWVKEFRRSAPHHAYFLLQALDLETYNAGSAVPTLNRNHVHGLPQLLPPTEVVERFETAVSPLFVRQRSNEGQTQILTEIRDTLLPKLISGEIRIPEAEKLVENVA